MEHWSKKYSTPAWLAVAVLVLVNLGAWMGLYAVTPGVNPVLVFIAVCTVCGAVMSAIARRSVTDANAHVTAEARVTRLMFEEKATAFSSRLTRIEGTQEQIAGELVTEHAMLAAVNLATTDLPDIPRMREEILNALAARLVEGLAATSNGKVSPIRPRS